MHDIVRPIAAITIFSLLGYGGWLLDNSRAQSRTALTGYFQSRPTQVASRTAGRVSDILVSEGAQVQPGQSLLHLEAEINVDTAKAAQAQAEQAKAAYLDVLAGPRTEDINKQEAAVAEMAASLARLQHGPLPEEISAAAGKARQADAAYRKALEGSRPQEIAQSRAAERAAHAHLEAVLRGPTQDERDEAKARWDSAFAQARLAESDAQRYENLFRRDAVSKQQFDQAITARDRAEAGATEAKRAYDRTVEGTPAEEREEARQAYLEAHARLNLAVAGSRREDVDAARAARDTASANLALIRRGTRTEDIAAARARLAQARAALAALRAGNRPQQIASTRAAADAAEAQAKASTKTASERTVTSPVAATIDRILVAQGDLLTVGQPIISETRPEDLFLRVYVPETDLARSRVGAIAPCRVDGIAGTIDLKVVSVSSQGEFTPANLQSPDERGKQVFAVRLQPAANDTRLKPGMFAQVRPVGEWR